MKVQPATSHNTHPKIRSCAALYQWLANFWHRSHIGHRSEYSVERLLAFRDYYQRTSITRAVAVCILTPIPAIMVALLIDCTPLRSPSDGWQANYAFWIRWFLAIVVVSTGATAQAREGIIPSAISNAGAMVIVLGVSVTDVSIAIVLAAMWRFPIPFGYIIMVGPYLLIISSFTLAVIGRRQLTESSVLRQQIKSQVAIIFAQGSVAMFFPFATSVFYQLSGPHQTAFVIIMPIFKHFTKHIIANAAEGLYEYVGPVVVFSVDVFNVFYVAICMQSSKSTVTTLLIIAADSFHVIIALRHIFHQANDATESQGAEPSGVQHTMNYFEDLPGMVHSVFKEQATSVQGCRVRVFAPFPLPLSDESSSFLNVISRGKQNTRVYSSSRTRTTGPSLYRPISSIRGSPVSLQQVKELQPCGGGTGVPKQNQVSPAKAHSEPCCKGEHAPRKGSAPRRLLTLLNTDTVISAERLRSTLTRSAIEEAVWDALQALFHSEYILMAEYIECVLPLLYAVYLSVLFHLPVATYYPQTASSTPDKLRQDVINIMIFGAVEFTGFVGLIFLLRRKFRISPLFQLSFVLETQWRTVQGHLFVWTVFILHMPLMHYGVDYDILFD